MKLGGRKDKKDKATKVAESGTYMTAFGERTREQVEAALAAAYVARAEKSALLERIRNGHVTLEELFSDAFAHDERAQRLPLGSALRATPGISAWRAGKIMDTVGVDHKRRIRGTGTRQRQRILELLAKSE